MAKRLTKEPKMLRKTLDGKWIISREWVGWCVLGHPRDEQLTANEVLDVIEERAPAFIGNPNVVAKVSRDGEATLTFTEKQ